MCPLDAKRLHSNDNMASGRIKIRSALDLNLFIMSFFGLWPPESFFGTWKLSAYKIYSVIVLGFFYFAYMLTEIINIVMVFGDINRTVEASLLFLTHASQLIKTIMVIVMNEKIRKLINTLDGPIFNKGVDEHNSIMNKSMKIVKRDTRWFLASALCTCALWAIFPSLNPERELPLKAWYPFNALKTPIFQVIFSYQIIAVALAALANISMDTLGSGIMALTEGQLDILHYDLSMLWRPTSAVKKDSKYLDKRLDECITLHQEIIKYVKDQEFTFSSMYLGQFIVAVMVICITVLELTMVPFGLKLFSMILYLICMLVEIFLYCYHGNEIIVKSLNLPDAVMRSGWYQEDKKFNRKLLFMMQKSMDPLKITTGKLFTLSLSTFLAILKSSYSYYALLQNVRNQ